MKVMIRRSPETGLSIYVPKKDLEEPIVESEHESLWGGWIRIANGWVLDLPEMAVGYLASHYRQCPQARPGKRRLMNAPDPAD